MTEHAITEVHFDFTASTHCPACGHHVLANLHHQWPDDTPVVTITGDLLHVLAREIDKHVGSHQN